MSYDISINFPIKLQGSQLLFTSLISYIILIFCILYWIKYYIKSKFEFTNDNKPNGIFRNYNKFYSQYLIINKKMSLKHLLTDRKYRSTLLYLWLISTGLMYMYYSTLVISPEISSRQPPRTEQQVKISSLSFSLLGHFILGITLKIENPKSKLLKKISIIRYLKNRIQSDLSHNSHDESENNDMTWIFLHPF